MPNKLENNFDLVIIGGGMVGLAFAAVFKKTSMKIAIIEAEQPSFDWDSTQYDLRVSAINFGSLNFFQEIGVWPAIEQERTSAYQKMFVWTAHSELQFTANEVNQPELGFIIENRVLRKCLWQQVSAQHNVTLLVPCKLAEVTINPNNAQLITTAGDTITAKLLIGADGAHSWLRQQLKLPVKTSSYGQDALVATVHTQLAHEHTAYQHFLPEGTVAFLPLVDQHHSSIVWYHTAATTQLLQNCDAAEFNEKLNLTFDKLGTLTLVSRRISFPLNKQHLEQYVQSRVAFIGDAAHTLHPLAGQGVNLGFRDARCLARVILNALENKKDFSSLAVLRTYERERKADNTLFLAAMDGLKYLFTDLPESLTSWRDRGVNLVNKSSTLKKLFIKQALGN